MVIKVSLMTIYIGPELHSATLQKTGFSIPGCDFPASSVCLFVFLLVLCLLQDSFCQTWWSRQMSITHHFSFLHNVKQPVISTKSGSYSFSDFLICDVIFVWDVQDFTVADILIFLSCHMIFSSIGSLVDCSVLTITSGFDPSSETVVPIRYSSMVKRSKFWLIY